MVKHIQQISDNSEGKSGLSSPLACPECGNQRNWKAGLRYIDGTAVQRYLCHSCGYRFSFSQSEDLKTDLNQPLPRQICVSLTEGTKNLTEVEQQTENWLVGATKNVNAELKETLFEYSWNLKRNGYAESTIITYTYLLRLFVKKCEPERP